MFPAVWYSGWCLKEISNERVDPSYVFWRISWTFSTKAYWAVSDALVLKSKNSWEIGFYYKNLSSAHANLKLARVGFYFET